jgi:hypothetical protein
LYNTSTYNGSVVVVNAAIVGLATELHSALNDFAEWDGRNRFFSMRPKDIGCVIIQYANFGLLIKQASM